MTGCTPQFNPIGDARWPVLCGESSTGDGHVDDMELIQRDFCVICDSLHIADMYPSRQKPGEPNREFWLLFLSGADFTVPTSPFSPPSAYVW